MNRRHFLKFIPLIPIAIRGIGSRVSGLGSENPIPLDPKPCTIDPQPSTPDPCLESMIARQKAMSELIERTGKLPYPANGHSYSDEEMEIIRPGAVRWIKKHFDQRRLQEQLQEQLNQRIRETLAERGIGKG